MDIKYIIKLISYGLGLSVCSLIFTVFVFLLSEEEVVYIELPDYLEEQSRNLSEENIDEYLANYEKESEIALRKYEGDKGGFRSFKEAKFKASFVNWIPWLLFGILINLKKKFMDQPLLFLVPIFLSFLLVFQWWEPIVFIFAYNLGLYIKTQRTILLSGLNRDSNP